jgi:RimJ/RimL family protein N-acetyltransferase
MPALRIETPRLLLRPPEAGDFDAFADHCADPHAMATLGGPQPRPVAWRTFTGLLGSWAALGYGMFAVLDRETGAYLGRIGPHHPDGWPAPEVGWGVTRAAEGRGLAFEAAVAATRFAFEALGWPEVTHCIEDSNARSAALARRLGSRPGALVTLPPPVSVQVRLWHLSPAAFAQATGG